MLGIDFHGKYNQEEVVNLINLDWELQLMKKGTLNSFIYIQYTVFFNFCKTVSH